MKINTILKTVGFLHLLLGVLLINMLIFSIDTIAPSASAETLLFIRGSADVVAATNIGIGFLLIISSSIGENNDGMTVFDIDGKPIRDYKSAKKVLLGELVLMSCLLIVAIFNTLNAGVIVDNGPPPPFWIVLILNPVLCIYGLLNEK
jgi:hypothetical protein